MVLRGCWLTPLGGVTDEYSMGLRRCTAALLFGVVSFLVIGAAGAEEQPHLTDLSTFEPAPPLPAQAPPSAGADAAIGAALIVVGASLVIGGLLLVTVNGRRLRLAGAWIGEAADPPTYRFPRGHARRAVFDRGARQVDRPPAAASTG